MYISKDIYQVCPDFLGGKLRKLRCSYFFPFLLFCLLFFLKENFFLFPTLAFQRCLLHGGGSSYRLAVLAAVLSFLLLKKIGI